MRDFRDAKVMARTLRDELKAKSVEASHSESLELIAKLFGFDNWNILASKIEAIAAPASEGDQTLHCSFCLKSQFQIRKLIAGPKVYICDSCVGLCGTIIGQEDLLHRLGDVDDGGAPADVSAADAVLAANSVAGWRNSLAEVRHVLAARRVPLRGEKTAEPPGLRKKTVDELIALEGLYERAIGRFEEAQRAAAVFDER